MVLHQDALLPDFPESYAFIIYIYISWEGGVVTCIYTYIYIYLYAGHVGFACTLRPANCLKSYSVFRPELYPRAELQYHPDAVARVQSRGGVE